MHLNPISSFFKSKQKEACATPSPYRSENSSIELDDEALATISGGATAPSDPIMGTLGSLTGNSQLLGGILAALGPLPIQ